MAAINIVKSIDLTPSSGPVSKLAIGNEVNAYAYQYYMTESYVRDKSAYIQSGIYNGLEWSAQRSSLTAKKCLDFGIKTFPGVGAIGYYTPLLGTSKMLIPVHAIVGKYEEAPVFSASVTENSILFTIRDPEDLSYTCYRILLEYDGFAIEYVTYESVLEVPKPDAGTYRCYCIGYLGEGQSISEDSNEIVITI